MVFEEAGVPEAVALRGFEFHEVVHVELGEGAVPA